MAAKHEIEPVRAAPLARAGVACGLLALSTVAYVVVAFSQSAESSAVLAVLVAGLALAALLALAWSAARGDFGSAVAWGYTALPLVVFVLLLALPFAHLSSYFPAQCDPASTDCQSAPAGAWTPLALLALCLLATWAAIRRSKAAGKAIEAAGPDVRSDTPDS